MTLSSETRKYRDSLLIGIFLCSLFLIPSANAQSQGDLHLTTSPLPINLITEPGRTIQTPLCIQNLPDSGRTFTFNWDDGFLRYIDKTEDGKVVHDANGNIEKVLD